MIGDAMGYLELFAQRTFAAETERITRGGAGRQDPPEIRLEKVQGDGFLVIRRPDRFPVLSRILTEEPPPVAALYVCPIRALLNNTSRSTSAATSATRRARSPGSGAAEPVPPRRRLRDAEGRSSRIRRRR
jgi:hypothetical protein